MLELELDVAEVVVVVDVDISGSTAASDTELDSEFVDFARIFCILLLN